MKGGNLYLSRGEALTLLTRLDDLVDLEPEVSDMRVIRDKVLRLLAIKR